MGYLGLLEAILGNLGAGGRENAIGVARIGGSGWAIGAGRRENAIGVARIGAETLKIATVSRFLWFLAPPGSPHKTGPECRETPRPADRKAICAKNEHFVWEWCKILKTRFRHPV